MATTCCANFAKQDFQAHRWISANGANSPNRNNTLLRPFRSLTISAWRHKLHVQPRQHRR